MKLLEGLKMTTFNIGDKVILKEKFEGGPGWLEEVFADYLENSTILEITEKEDVNGWIEAKAVSTSHLTYYYPVESLTRLTLGKLLKDKFDEYIDHSKDDELHTKSSKHKHAELIHAWADGAKIQWQDRSSVWFDVEEPSWHPLDKFRIKPELREFYLDITLLNCLNDDINSSERSCSADTVKVVFDTETNKLVTLERFNK